MGFESPKMQRIDAAVMYSSYHIQTKSDDKLHKTCNNTFTASFTLWFTYVIAMCIHVKISLKPFVV